jgi:hypothetical protein
MDGKSRNMYGFSTEFCKMAINEKTSLVVKLRRFIRLSD